MTPPYTEANEIWLLDSQLRVRYGGKTAMWLWRQRHHDADWPKPMVINGRNYTALSEIIKYERLKRAASAAAHVDTQAAAT